MKRATAEKCRCSFLSNIVAGLVVALAIAALIVSIKSIRDSSFSTQQTTYTTSGGPLYTFPAHHVLAGVNLTLPNNMIEYVGATYNVECTLTAPSTIVIAAGTLITNWNENSGNRTARCANGGGFTFRVIGSSVIHIVESRLTTFS